MELSTVSRSFGTKVMAANAGPRRHTVTDFVGGVGTGLEFAITSGSAGDFTVDTVNTRHGSESVKVTAGAGTSKIFYSALPTPQKFADYVSGRFTFYCADPTNLTGLYFYLYSTPTTVSHFISVPVSKIVAGWNVYSFNRSEYQDSDPAPPDWDSTARVSFRVIAGAGGSAEVSFDFLEFYNPENTRPICVLSFDDGYDSLLSIVKPELDARGWSASVFAPNTVIGTAGRLTIAQLLALESAGWDIGVHPYGHQDYVSINETAVRANILTSIQYLVDNGFKYPTSFAYAVGSAIGRKKESIVKEKFRFARGAGNPPCFEYSDSIPFGIPEHTRSIAWSLGASAVVAELAKIKDTRGVSIGYTHDVAEVAPEYGCSTADFLTICDYLEDNNFEVLNVRQFIAKYPNFDLL